MEGNRGQPHTSDSDNETQHFFECLLAPTSGSESDSESDSVGETDECNRTVMSTMKCFQTDSFHIFTNLAVLYCTQIIACCMYVFHASIDRKFRE